MVFNPITLRGKLISLEPMNESHIEALSIVGLDPSLWRWTPTVISTAEEMGKYVRTALDDQSGGVALPFVTRENGSGRIIGSTRFGNIDEKNRRVEIGWTWIATEWQRTFVNTEAKFLMLRQAFEVWNCVRVELKTDALNEKSRAAILRLGARQEGIFRNHVITDSGRFRDTVYFSILDSEWEPIKHKLLEKIGK